MTFQPRLVASFASALSLSMSGAGAQRSPGTLAGNATDEATAGLPGIAAQSTLDFSLQMPGNAMMFAVLLAIALHRPSSQHAHRV